MRTTTRRERLIRFIDFHGDRHGQYAVRIGFTRVTHDVLTDDALESLVDRMCRDFWMRREMLKTHRRPASSLPQAAE